MPDRDLDLDALRAAAEAATPGPWERGDPWLVAGVFPENFGEGRCAYCDRHGEPVWTGVRDINGQRMLAHVHRDAEPYGMDHLITAADGQAGAAVAGNYDYEAGGIIEARDTAYIAAADPSTVLALLDRVERAENALWQIADRDGEHAVKRPAWGELHSIAMRALLPQERR
jgi:hypothetical protein